MTEVGSKLQSGLYEDPHLTEALAAMRAGEEQRLEEEEGGGALPEANLQLLLSTQLPRRSFFRWFLNRWMLSYTPAGRALFLALLIAGSSAAGFDISYPIYFFAAFLLTLWAVTRTLGWMFLPRVDLERDLPGRCAAGATVEVIARVTNRSRLPGFDLAIREEPDPPPIRFDAPPLEYLDVLPAGETTELRYSISPEKRGLYEFRGPFLVTAFPFGLYHVSRRIKLPHRLIVYPRFAPLLSIDLPTGRRHQPGGLQLVSAVGDSEEFVGNREYRPGDRLRDIHHMAWARIGFPVVREFEQEYLTRIALVVDTYVRRPSAKMTRTVEAAISLGAGVADVLSRQEYVIDVFAAGPELYHFQAGRSLAYLDDILDVLACVEECTEDPFPRLGPAVMEEMEQLSTAVVVYLDWDQTRLDFTRSIQERGVETKVIVVRDGPTTLDTAGFVSAAGPIQLFTPEQAERGVGRL